MQSCQVLYEVSWSDAVISHTRAIVPTSADINPHTSHYATSQLVNGQKFISWPQMNL